MACSDHVRVEIDLGRIRRNVEAIRHECAVPVIAVIKADAYGLGAAPIADGVVDLVDSFCVFYPDEARGIEACQRTSSPTLAIGPPVWSNPQQYIASRVRPAVSTAQQARELRDARPVLCVDAGQQRFACPPPDASAVLEAGSIDEAFTHAVTLAQVAILREAVAGKVARMHAAGSSLLHEPQARLDAVRPGLAMYREAVRVSTRLVEVHENHGPAGYSGFVTPRHGVILAGYSHGLRPGPCFVNGRPSRILEVGMQSAFVQTDVKDREGDEVVLLGDALTAQQIAPHWGTTPHEVLLRLAGSGARHYRGPG